MFLVKHSLDHSLPQMNANDISCAIKVLTENDDIAKPENLKYLVKAMRAAIDRRKELSPLDKAEITQALKEALLDFPEAHDLASIASTSSL